VSTPSAHSAHGTSRSDVGSAAARNWRTIAVAARLIVGGLFIVSAIGKIADPGAFLKEVRDYQMLPLVATNAVAYILPWLELFAGALLITGLWRGEAALIIAALLVVFTVAKTWTYARGIELSGCGCGGKFAVLNYIYDTPQGILTNIVLLGLLCADHHAQRLRRRAAARPEAAG